MMDGSCDRVVLAVLVVGIRLLCALVSLAAGYRTPRAPYAGRAGRVAVAGRVGRVRVALTLDWSCTRSPRGVGDGPGGTGRRWYRGRGR